MRTLGGRRHSLGCSLADTQGRLTYARARQIADLAARKAEPPTTIDALAAGELAFEQAHAVAVHAPAHADKAAAQLARVTTVGQLRSTLSRYRYIHPAPDASTMPAVPGPPPGHRYRHPSRERMNQSLVSLPA